MSEVNLSGDVGEKRLISRAALARRAGVSRAAITKACRSSLSEAVAHDRVDIDHPAVVAYVARKTAPSADHAASSELGALADAVANVLVRRLGANHSL